MDINDIEQNLGAFNADQHELLSAILNINIRNQAILESILSFQIELFGRRDPNSLNDKSLNNIHKRMLEIQAEVVNGFNKGQ